MKLLFINGPNLNMLGIRETEIYGNKTYDDLVKYIEEACRIKNIKCEVYQSNHEGDIITKIQDAYGKVSGIIINPASYTHTSIGILDALKAVSIPTVEVHLSDIDNREDFRKISYVGMVSKHRIAGKGFEGYREAIDYFVERRSTDKNENSNY